MEIKKNITIELSEQDVQEIIVDYLTRKGYKITNVRFLVGSKIEGFGMDEHEVRHFQGACVNCAE